MKIENLSNPEIADIIVCQKLINFHKQFNITLQVLSINISVRSLKLEM